MEIEILLKNHRKSITDERKNLFEAMQKTHLFSACELEKAFPNIARASIFRTVLLFSEIGAIRKINLGKKEDFYEVVSDHHHEHMRCEQCESILSFEAHSICHELEKIAKEQNFSLKNHQIILSGICEKCSG